MTPDELLDAAADEMTIRGSCAEEFENDEGNVCMLGAITRAHKGSYDILMVVKARTALTQTLEESRPDTHPFSGFIAIWNDSHTHDERIEALRQGAKYYREHSQQGGN